MKKFACLFTFYLFKIFAAVDPAALVTVDASPIFAGCVNAITGTLIMNETDLVIPAIEPIVINRSYSSSNTLERDGGWDFFSYAKLYRSEYGLKLYLKDPMGFKITLYHTSNDEEGNKILRTKLALSKGMTNAFGELSARTNIENYSVKLSKNHKKATLTTGDGTQRIYKKRKDLGFWRLKKIIKPNGFVIKYTLDDAGDVQSIETKSEFERKTFAKIDVTDREKNNNFHLKAPDGREVIYYHDRFSDDPYFYLECVEGCGIKENYGYKKFTQPLVNEIKAFDDQRLVAVYFDEKFPHEHYNRVKKLQYPDANGNLHTLYTFEYTLASRDEKGNFKSDSSVKIHDRKGNITTYTFDKNEILKQIEFSFRGKPIKKEEFKWDKGRKLKCKTIHDYVANQTSAREFKYDDHGNVEEETFFGNLVGSKDESLFTEKEFRTGHCGAFKKVYNYKNNLPISVKDDTGLMITYDYKEGTDLISKKATSKNGKIYIRKFYEYNEDNILVCEIEDDGTTNKKDGTYTTRKLKKITPDPIHGLPRRIEEYYLEKGNEVLLSAVEFDYTNARLVENERHYDANNALISTIFRKYDKNTGEMREETFKGADGKTKTTTFDYKKRNLDSKKDHASSVVTSYDYDRSNRLREKKETAGKISFSTTYAYDLYGKKVLETDFRGNEMRFSYGYCDYLAKTLVAKNSCEVEFPEIKGLFKKSEYDNFNRIYNDFLIGRYAYDEFHNLLVCEHSNFKLNPSESLFEGIIRKPQYERDLKNDIPILEGKYLSLFSEIHQPSDFEAENFYSECQECDIYGNTLKKRDPLGNTTTFAYNAYGSPIKITHPDGKAETLVYFPDGKLKEKTDTSKVVTAYEYDDLGRETNKTIFSPNGEKLAEETKTYDSFHLRTFKDAEGHLTEYFYDAAGRKSKEVTNDRETLFSYDSAGRLYAEATLIDGKYLVTITERNSLNEVFEKRIEERVHPDMEGTVLGKTTYIYYDTGKLKEEIEHISDEKTSIQSYTYDDFGRLISSTNPFGHTTTIEYDDYFEDENENIVLKITTTDPLNIQTIQTMNMQGEIALEKKENASTTLSKEKFFYDDAKNLVKQESSIIYDGEETHKITTAWEYDNMQRLEKLTEAKETPEEKVTKYEYTPAGQIENITKPDGTLLKHTYDDLGYLTHLESNDGSIHHEFKVDLLGNIEEAIDHNSKLKKTTCKYDDFGNLEMETLQNGLTLQKNYDSLDRPQKITFHDGTVVEKVYDALYLEKVIRKDSEGHELYSHLYQEYDLSGNLCKESLPENLGVVDYFTDDSGRINSIISPYHQETITKQDPLGRTKVIERLHSSSSYEYDDLGQLISEEGLFSHTYGYDSHHCRQVSDDSDLNYNSLHQLKTIDDETSIEYDPNGNPQKKSFPEGEIIYTCDKLDRLISYEIPGRIYAEYTYDPFHRRMSKRLVYPDGTEAMQLFLYDGDNEIGSTDTSGTIRELRILGHTARAERSAVAFELHGKTYFPLPDLFGNVSCLLSSEGQVESYEYDAFGNENAPEDPISPWRYAAKRVDFESDLIYFGRRYYDPVVGIWLTPDPAGYTKGLNLYAYVCNDPLMSFDLYGLLLCMPNSVEHGENAFVPKAINFVTEYSTLPRQFVADFTHTIYGYGSFIMKNEKSLQFFKEVMGTGPLTGQKFGANEIMQGHLAIDEFFGVDVTPSYLNRQVTFENFSICELPFGPGGAGTAAAKSLSSSAKKLLDLQKGGIRYGPLMEGPLEYDVVRNFRSNSYTEILLNEPVILFRVYGGKAGICSPWWSEIKPLGSIQARIDSALLKKWGNTAEYACEIEVPIGTKIYKGSASSQIEGVEYLLGGGNQIYIPNVKMNWIRKNWKLNK